MRMSMLKKESGINITWVNSEIKNVQKNQTAFFIFLLQDAKDRGDDIAFKKLMQSAHKRRAVNSAKVDAKFS